MFWNSLSTDQKEILNTRTRRGAVWKRTDWQRERKRLKRRGERALGLYLGIPYWREPVHLPKSTFLHIPGIPQTKRGERVRNWPWLCLSTADLSDRNSMKPILTCARYKKTQEKHSYDQTCAGAHRTKTTPTHIGFRLNFNANDIFGSCVRSLFLVFVVLF